MKKSGLEQRMYGIQRKLLLYVMLLILSVLVLVTIGTGLIAGKNVKKNLVEQYSYVNDKYYQAFEGFYEDLETLTENCITNSNIQNSLTNQVLSVYDKEVIARTLRFVGGDLVDAYAYVDNKGNLYYPGRQLLPVDDFIQGAWYQELAGTYSEVKLVYATDILGTGSEKALYAGRYVRQMERNYAPGAICMRLNLPAVETLSKETENDTPAYFIRDSKGMICAETYPGYFGKTKRARQQIEAEIRAAKEGMKETGQGFVFTKTHAKTGFSVITFVPDQVVYKVTRQMAGMLILAFFVVLCAAFLLSRTFARQFTSPIRTMSSLMENFDDGNLSERIELHTNTELDEIGNSYNKMLTRIEGLIGQVTYKERELRKAELDTLLYQIQPHFLYNTLDTVYMLARISREETIMQMIQSLSSYLRINLSNGAEKIRVGEELSHVKAYLDIQNIRNSGLFTYEIEADESVRNYFVMKMILQPIAENCIKHGFADCEEEAKIWISVKELGEDVVFTVENNGVRMEDRQCERMNRLEKADIEQIASAVAKEKGGYGIFNIVKRLRLGYEEQIRFYYVVSAKRTTCVIKIKKEMMISNENPNQQSPGSTDESHTVPGGL